MRPLRAAVRLLASATIATTVGLAPSSPAHAAQVDLDPAHQQVLAGDVTQRCAEGTGQLDPRMAARGPHEDGWFFEVGAGTMVSLTARFAPPDGAADELVITGAVADPDSPIHFYQAGPFVPHAYLFTPAGWRLVFATAEVHRGSRLILRYACAGERAATPDPTPAQTPTPIPGTSPSANPTATPTQPSAQLAPPDQRPGLAATGARVGGLLVLGSGLVAAGVALLAVRRRRNLSHLADLSDESADPPGGISL